MSHDIRKIANKVLNRGAGVSSFRNMSKEDQEGTLDEFKIRLENEDAREIVQLVGGVRNTKFKSNDPKNASGKLYSQKGSIGEIPVELVYCLEDGDDPFYLSSKEWVKRLCYVMAGVKGAERMVWKRIIYGGWSG